MQRSRTCPPTLRSLLAASGTALGLALAGPVSADRQFTDTYSAAAPSQPPVTAADIAERDRMWPFRAILSRPWKPPGAERPLPARPGVLVRVNPDGTARVDFASLGRHDVPIELTDLVAQAERVRTGELAKMAPNLVLTIGNKMIDGYREELSVFHIGRSTRLRGILCVYLDPDKAMAAALRERLASLDAHPDVQVVLFPQTEKRDRALLPQLRAAGLAYPFVRERYVKPFTRSLAGQAASPLPYAQLLTPDGRLLAAGAADRALLGKIGERFARVAAAAKDGR